MAQNELQKSILRKVTLKETQEKKNKLIDTLMIVLTLVIAINPNNSNSLLIYLIFCFIVFSIILRCLDLLWPIYKSDSYKIRILYAIFYLSISFILPLILVALFFTHPSLNDYLESYNFLLVYILIPVLSTFIFISFTTNLFDIEKKDKAFDILFFTTIMLNVMLLFAYITPDTSSFILLLVSFLVVFLLSYVVANVAQFLLINIHKIMKSIAKKVVKTIAKKDNKKKDDKDKLQKWAEKHHNSLKIVLYICYFLFFLLFYVILSMMLNVPIFSINDTHPDYFIQNVTIITNESSLHLENVSLYLQK